MTRPKLSHNAGVYTLLWAAEQVAIRIDRIREDSKYNVSGEVLVGTTIPGVPEGHLHQARLNLTSTASRVTLAKMLTQRVDTLDWGAILEQACVTVLEEHRKGEPVVDLSTLPSRESLRYRYKPLLLEGLPNLFYGDGGIGKSLVALYISVAIQLPWDDMGFEAQPGNALYLDYEMSSHDTRERMLAICKAFNGPPDCPVLYRFCHQPLAAEIEEVQRIVAARNIELVVVDSAGPACGGKPEDAEMTIGYFSALRSLRVTSLTLAHVAKNPQQKTIFGSAYWFNLARGVFELKKAQEAGQGDFSIGIFHRKSNATQLLRPIGLHVSIATNEAGILESVALERIQVKDVPELAEALPLKERVSELLKGGQMAPKDIAEAIGKPLESVYMVLNRHKGRAFVKLGNTWGLTQHPGTLEG